MEVRIANTLDVALHVAVVKHSALNVEFVISPGRVPIPSGDVQGHWDLEPGTALSLKGVHIDAQLSLSVQNYEGTIGVTVANMETDDGPLSLVTLAPPIGTDDGPKGTPSSDLN